MFAKIEINLSRTEIHHNSETSSIDLLKCKVDNHILIVSICMGKDTISIVQSIRMQRVKIIQLSIYLFYSDEFSHTHCYNLNRNGKIHFVF